MGPSILAPSLGPEARPCIQLTATQTLIRYISEWDPREVTPTKGGYLEGVIAVPEIQGKLRMEVSTFPATNSVSLTASVHPMLLHLVRIGSQRREQELEPVPNFIHWRQVFEIEHGEVFVLNQRSELDVEKDGSPRIVPERDLVSKVKPGGTIVLGRKCGNLNLILLQPKQRTRAQRGEATVTKVLMDRLGMVNQDHVTPYEIMFTGKNTRNMKRLRIKVDFVTENLQYSVISTQTIIDSGNKDVGAMDFVDAHPLQCCVKGGRRAMLVSEYNLAKDIRPVFLVYSVNPETEEEEERPDLEQFLVQPSDIEVRNTQVLFYCPAQPRVGGLPGPCRVRLAVRREGDGHVSQRKFDWRFEEHKIDGNCVECDWNVDLV